VVGSSASARQASTTVAPTAASAAARPRAIHAWPASEAIQPAARRPVASAASSTAPPIAQCTASVSNPLAAGPAPATRRSNPPPIGSHSTSGSLATSANTASPSSTITQIRAHAIAGPPQRASAYRKNTAIRNSGYSGVENCIDSGAGGRDQGPGSGGG